MSRFANAAVGGVLLVSGFTLQNISIVYWTSAPISAYGILLYANLFFTAFFGALLLAFSAATRDPSALLVADAAPQRALCSRRGGRATLAQLALLVGLMNILNGFLIVYSSPPDRTPPLIQAVLQNSGVLFAVPASKLVLGDRKRYCAAAPLAAAALVAGSIAVSVLPTALAGVGGEFAGGGAATVAWILVYLLGIAPGAVYNVVQQLFLIRSGALAPGVSRRAIARASLRALFYCNAAQLFWLLALWWVDVLPWFGASATVSEFAANTAFSLRCSLGLAASDAAGDGCGTAQFATSPSVWAASFAAAYSVSYVGSVLLNRESAAFNMICAVITTALTSLYFLLPHTNPNAANTPLWSVVVALALSLTGLVLWKRWEAATPADEQFAANDDAGGEQGGEHALSLTGGDTAAAKLRAAGGGGGAADDLDDALLPAAQAGAKPLLDGWR